MTQEDKELLFKDLCARLPYGVKIQIKDWTTFETELKVGHIQQLQNEDIDPKPYLRPMSSMTEEEERELRILWNEDLIGERSPFYIYPCYSKTMDFYNSHHFDYRGLIEKGLAIEALEGMYDLKEK